jgi:ribosomal protein S27AE
MHYVWLRKAAKGVIIRGDPAGVIQKGARNQVFNETIPKLTDPDLQETRKPDTENLSDTELGQVSAGQGNKLCCPKCGSGDIVWNNSIGFWVCGKCNHVWT